MRNQKGVAHILFLVILIAGLFALLYLSQKSQIFKPKAYSPISGPISEPIYGTPIYFTPKYYNTPPKASISGPGFWIRGIPLNFNAKASDIDVDLKIGEIWVSQHEGTPTPDKNSVSKKGAVPAGCPLEKSGENACLISENQLEGESQGFSATWAPPEPGVYIVFVQVYDQNELKCSASYQYLGSEWADCGEYDFLILRVF